MPGPDYTSGGDKYEKYPMVEHLPIPTYEEATSSRAASPYDDNDGESTQLLQHSSSHYRPPHVESVRSSSDSSFLEEFGSARGSNENLQREMVQMEVEDGAREKRGIFESLTKKLSSISSSLSFFSFPRNALNIFRGLRIPSLPPIPCLTGTMVPVVRLMAVLIALVVLYALLASDAFQLSGPVIGGFSGPFNPESVRNFVTDAIDGQRIASDLRYLTSFDHVAGTEGDGVLAKWIEGEFASFGLDVVDKAQYWVYLNYPKPEGRKVSISGTEWVANLDEPAVDAKHENTLVFHGHSKTGTAEGPLIYANYGAREDFAQLMSWGIDVRGAIVLVRYGGTQGDRALKVKAAELAGAAGCLIFSDPKTEGWAWPADAVQRGAVSLMSWVVGDVLTPGYPALDDVERLPVEGNKGLVGIPSLPLSWRDAQHLLLSIRGMGKKLDDDWSGKAKDVDEWWTGAHDESPKVNLQNDQVEREKQPIWNIMGSIRGAGDYDKQVVIGNHRDAWCFGASDPNSGTAAMLEVARVFGQMMQYGWRPSRTIVFASWDAEEYNLIGSTEWVEEHIGNLRNSGTAYINLDTAVTGKEFTASGSPVLANALKNVLSRVYDPKTNETLQTLWGDKDLPGLGAGSDYVAFMDFAGMSSIDISFGGDGFPYHSCFDNYQRMAQLGDPDWKYHETLAKVLGLLVLELADTPILPYNMTDYGHALKRYTQGLEDWIEARPTSKDKLDLNPLHDAINVSMTYLTQFDNQHDDWMELDEEGLYKGAEDPVANSMRYSRSYRMSNFDKHLLDLDEGGGVPGREWFKHVVFAPQAWSGYDPGYFPGIRDAVDNGNWTLAQSQVEKVSNIIKKASHKLVYNN